MTIPEKPATIRIVAGDAPKRRRRGLEISLLAALVLLIGAGAAVASVTQKNAPAPTAAVTTPAATLKLGYFGNVTHAPALIGLQQGFFQKDLGATKLSTQVFNAGPAAVEALNAGAIDAAYLGPNPAINSFVKSRGESLRVIAGAASGGAQLVVKPSIRTAADLKGKVLATPQLGGTQDVALRSWLGRQGLKSGQADAGAPDAVTINPTDNAAALKLFQDGKLDGAWLPEPWASRLVLQAGATVLVDEKDLWDGSLTAKPGQFPTTILVVNKNFLDQHPETVRALLKGHVESVQWLRQNPAAAAEVINAGLTTAAGSALPADVLSRSLSGLSFTDDPLAGTYRKLLQDGVDAGTTKSADLGGMVNLGPLNAVLRDAGLPAVSAAGLGSQ
ncbi:ABC transporter substrate-binding protein [Paenarthrobacter sp. PH39-S1]|uniref:ABC transporter substrate-binding protein n=1 Tax=Paenarthrobacter sp. PH39-S1 TaxID=3046204 RepID=UPI0024BA63E8|nr:ABC transporter substrate-binding protein [Paenarthrobacter sp. PH39-S1]MDJ0355055.1 ABC transporter substrate-binding protein [Paenarthrobacter sp. PH39-S1]